MEKIKRKNREIKTNENIRKILKIFLVLLSISYLLSASYGLIFNKIFAEELSSKYSCFRYDTIEACTTLEYIYNSLIVFPKHFIFEIPLGMLTNLGSIFEIFIGIGMVASLIVIYNFLIIIILIYLIIRSRIKEKK